MPPYLAGRTSETREFGRLLKQDTILENLVLTGLRGVGKTVLLDTFKPIAMQAGWHWVGTDLSEAMSLTELTIAIRLLTDLSVVTSSITIGIDEVKRIGFGDRKIEVPRNLDYRTLSLIYEETPGLAADKIKAVLELVWSHLRLRETKGLIFAYDEAQNLSDHAAKDEFPLSLLLDVFQSIQKKGIPFMLVLTGLPTLFPRLVEARTFAERMFRVVFLDRLDKEDSREAIVRPLEETRPSIDFTDDSVTMIIDSSGGYPYFIQFICREMYDVFMQEPDEGETPSVPMDGILRKLDSDFFAGRWARATDRQRQLLEVIAGLPNCDREFTVQEIVTLSKIKLERPFGGSHVNQMLSTLSEAGLVYKNRHGKYSFAVPLLGEFIRRQAQKGV
jgi:hypothetical protein